MSFNPLLEYRNWVKTTNSPNKYKVVELIDKFDNLKHNDPYYGFSDDHNVWQRGYDRSMEITYQKQYILRQIRELVMNKELKKFLDLVKETLETKPEFEIGLCYYWFCDLYFKDIDAYSVWEFYRNEKKLMVDSLGPGEGWNKERVDYCQWILDEFPSKYWDFLKKYPNDVAKTEV